jgi:hypothetical protein
VPAAAEFEYALRCMFSSTTANGRRATDGGGGGVDGAAADEAAGRVIKVIADKRALQVEVCIKRLRMDAPALAAALNRIDTDRLKVRGQAWGMVHTIWNRESGVWRVVCWVA